MIHQELKRFGPHRDFLGKKTERPALELALVSVGGGIQPRIVTVLTPATERLLRLIVFRKVLGSNQKYSQKVIRT